MAPAIDKHRLLSVAAAVVLGGAPTVCFYIYDTGTEASSLSSSLVLCCVSRALNLPIKIRFLPFFLSACHHENWAPPHYLVQYTLYCTGTAAVCRIVFVTRFIYNSFLVYSLAKNRFPRFNNTMGRVPQSKGKSTTTLDVRPWFGGAHGK